MISDHLKTRTYHHSINLATLCLFLTTASAYSAPIVGLYNTGTGLSEGEIDTHYSFSVISGTATNTSGYSYVGENISPYWMPNDIDSKWLTPHKDGNTSFDNESLQDGLYVWTLTFNLDGFDPNTASFTARMMSDNSSVVRLNGTQIATVGDGGYLSWAVQFGAHGFFVSGINVLEFSVTNYIGRSFTNNPTGLRVEFLESNAAPIPEPETYALLLAGLGLMGVVVRRRKQLVA